MTKRIAVDLGGTKTEIMLTEENPQEILRRERIPTNRKKGYKHIVEQLASMILDYKSLCDEKTKIGIGTPGSISPTTGLMRNSNTQCLNGEPLKKDLENRIGQTVRIENDANCFTLSEATFGAGKGHQAVIGIIMGTGMGGGFSIDGKIRDGRLGIAGEWGHSSINYDGPECWCGQRGCLELYLSGTGVEREYRRLTGAKSTLEDIYEQYRSGQQKSATETINWLLSHFGRGMANLINCFDPDIVVIGGGVSNISELYTLGVEEIGSRIFGDEFTTPVVMNQLGDSSGIFGAALIAE